MKKIVLAVMILFVAVTAQAQCVAEIKNVIQDPIRGSIVVQTEYVLNGEVVDVDASPCWLDEDSGKHFITLVHPKTKQLYNKECIGENRFLETSGTNAEIIERAKIGINAHRDSLIKRIDKNEVFLRTEKLKIQKALTQPIIDEIKGALLGYTSSSTEVTETFKGKDIKVTYDQKNTVTNTIIVVE